MALLAVQTLDSVSDGRSVDGSGSLFRCCMIWAPSWDFLMEAMDKTSIQWVRKCEETE